MWSRSSHDQIEYHEEPQVQTEPTRISDRYQRPSCRKTNQGWTCSLIDIISLLEKSAQEGEQTTARRAAKLKAEATHQGQTRDYIGYQWQPCARPDPEPTDEVTHYDAGCSVPDQAQLSWTLSDQK